MFCFLVKSNFTNWFKINQSKDDILCSFIWRKTFFLET